MIVCTWHPYSVSLHYPFEDNIIEFQHSELIESGSERLVFPVFFCKNISQSILLKKKDYI